MRVAVFNAGSATAKVGLVEVEDGATRTLGRSSRELGAAGGARAAFVEAVKEIAPDASRVHAIGHRVVHGGSQFTAPVRVDASVEQAIAALGTLAPLHNPLTLEGMRVAREEFPGRPMVAVFDTAFHADRRPESLRDPLPWALCDELGLLRYGFHGIAHASLLESLAAEQDSRPEELDAVTLQLGAGCSACAIEQGRSIETSMGFSPLGGLPMATRAGDLDPGVPLELLRRGYAASEIEMLLTRQSGLLGLAGSADMREVLEAETSGDPRARVAVALFVRRVVAVVGAYFTLLRGRGALVFGGGIGARSAEIRRRVVHGLAAWNLELDGERNASDGGGLVSAQASRPIYVFDTDEETQIAHRVVDLLRCR